MFFRLESEFFSPLQKKYVDPTHAVQVQVFVTDYIFSFFLNVMQIRERENKKFEANLGNTHFFITDVSEYI